MQSALWLIPLPPLVAFVLLALAGRRVSDRAAGLGACAAIAMSAVAATGAALALGFRAELALPLWRWLDVGGLTITFALRLDALGAVMSLVVAWVSLLIAIYATEYMRGADGYRRFFAHLCLCVGAMLVLVTADDLVLLYLGWEGVGVASYLLIGFWHYDPASLRAARKAFIYTRVGDTALAIGLLWLAVRAGTLAVPELGVRAPLFAGVAVPIASLVLLGAIAKSAQFPLHAWLPDAMVGPTPVSALIHAATMVTAGVYLLARLHALLSLAPAVMAALAVVGAVTLLLAALAACAQREIKAVLAYSTISQLGYMFLALGVGAHSAAIIHAMMHAFFKAALFLGAGVVVHATGGEQRLAHMGGLARRLPVTCACMVAAAASLAALPFVSAGFYSRDAILWHVLQAGPGGGALWAIGTVGAGLTGFYAFRALFLIFAGPLRTPVSRRVGLGLLAPLVVLAVLSIAAGLVALPRWFELAAPASRFLARSLPEPAFAGGIGLELGSTVVSGAAALLGIVFAYRWYLVRHAPPDALPVSFRTQRFLEEGLGFDRACRAAFVRPFEIALRALEHDCLDAPFRGIARAVRGLHVGLAWLQSGRVRGYLVALALGALALLFVALA